MIEKMRHVTLLYETKSENGIFVNLQKAGLVQFEKGDVTAHPVEQLTEMLAKVKDLLASYPEINFHQSRQSQDLDGDLELMTQLSAIKEEIRQTKKEVESLTFLFCSILA